MSEELILTRVAVEQELARLKSPEKRLVLELVYGLVCPEDWDQDERWPPTYAAVGRYVGRKFRGEPLSEAAIRYQEMCALEELNPALALTPKRRKARQQASEQQDRTE